MSTRAVTPRQSVEDIYPLAPTQEGMLFHTLHSPEHGVYLTQYTCLLRGLDLGLFTAAWQRVIDRHPALRTAFVWRSTAKPMQVVGRSVELPLEERDWRHLTAEQREVELEAYLAADRSRGFEPNRAPLTRLAAMRIGTGAYRLVWSFHHLILDGWCRAIVLSEVLAAYGALAGGSELRFARPRPYRDYIWWLQRQDLVQAEAFWRESLRGFTAPTPLRVDHPPAGEAESHASRSTLLAAATTEELLGFARRNRLTLSTVVQGAWSLLLGRYSGEPEVVYGTVVSGRPPEIEGVESIVGMFINTLPVRVEIADAPLAPWLGQLQRRQAEMRHYEYSPLVQVQKWSEVPQGTPLFESIFAFENFPQEEGFANGLELEDVRSIQRGNYPLAGAAAPGERMLLRLFYACNRFDLATIERALGHFQTLLEGMAAATPGTRLGDLPLLTEGERRQVLLEWNGGVCDLPGSCFHELFAAQVARTPKAMAVVSGAEHLTYWELDERSDRLGHHLRRLGVGPEVRVGLLLERSAAAVVAMMAVWKAGGAYVPLSSGLPAERLAFLLADAGLAVLLTDQRLAATVPETAARVVLLDADRERIAAAVPIGQWPVASPENLAYVIYTSGSTGRPKGVAVEHRQLTHYVAAIHERLGLPAGATFASVSTLAADLGHTTLFTPLWTGGCLHLLSAEDASDGEAMGDYFARHPISCLKIVPTHLAALMECRHPESLLPRCRLVLGGEAADARLVRRLRELAPECALFNHYGPTESTVGILTHRARPAESEAGGALPLGQPLGESRVYLVDTQGQLAPVGVPAELCVAGPSLARGYLGRPDLTAGRFLPDPFGAEAGGRLYRTGDLARYLPDGVIEFLGRIDHQVKIRGFRVEPQEVEAVLASHPGIAGAVVTPRQDPSGACQLVAYAAPRRRIAPAAGRPLELPSGLAVHHLNKNETEHLYRQIFESQIYLRHGIGLAEGACVFDVGANIGMFTLFAHHVCERLRLFAFEPSPYAFDRLAANVERYGLEARLFACALSNREGTAEFTIYPRASVMSGLYADQAAEEELFRDYMVAQEQEGAAHAAELLLHADELAAGRFEKQIVECPLRTVSSVIREHGIERIDLLKVDAERSELDILEGIEPQDWAKIQQVTAEVHGDGRLTRAVELLQSRGFEVALEQDPSLRDTSIHHLYARRPGPAVDGRRERPWRTLVPAPQPEAVPPEELREYLASRLPDYMVPSRILLLDGLPLLANGKVDRAALPSPEESATRPATAEDSFVAPRTTAEQCLAGIWSEVLGVERVGIHDNFFELGGDSILNIQIVARAHRAGLRLSPSQLFKHPTVAELAAVAGAVAAPRASSQAQVSGAVPLTPIQAWFFERELADPHHFAMPLLLELRRAMPPPLLERALAALLDHHDALRLGFRREAGGWAQWSVSPGECRAALGVCDLSALPPDLAGPALAAAGEALQAGFDLGHPPLVSAGFFRRGGGRSDLLLLAVHHLVVDGVSWRILLEDLATACDQLRRGEAVALPPQTTSFKAWSERLRAHVLAGGLAAEADHWRALAGTSTALPVDLAGGPDTSGSARSISAALSAEETEVLLRDVPPIYGTEIHEVLLAALARALGDWAGWESVLIDLEGHGREELVEGVDLTRTVGWLTTHYPVLLKLPEPAAPGEDLKAVKERLRTVPNRGIGYGALRYLSADAEVREAYRALPQPRVKFNYLGQLDRGLPEDFPFLPSWEDTGAARSPRVARAHRIEVAGGVSGGCLWLRWTYGERHHRAATVQALSDGFLAALRAILAHCLAPEAGGYTPSDFPEANLNQQALDFVLAQMDGADEI